MFTLTGCSLALLFTGATVIRSKKIITSCSGGIKNTIRTSLTHLGKPVVGIDCAHRL